MFSNIQKYCLQRNKSNIKAKRGADPYSCLRDTNLSDKKPRIFQNDFNQEFNLVQNTLIIFQ